MHSVAISAGTTDKGTPCFFVKLSGPDCELNLMMLESELELLRSVRESRWLKRGSIAAGNCLGSPAYWSCQDGRLSVLVGPDDEAWEVSYSAPEALVHQLQREIARARSE